MQINPNCVRDLLTVIEKSCDCDGDFEYDKSNKPVELINYTHNAIIYHALQCHEAGLFKSFLINDEETCFLVSDLEPEGYRFLAELRDNATWKKVTKRTFLTLVELIKIVLPYLPMMP